MDKTAPQIDAEKTAPGDSDATNGMETNANTESRTMTAENEDADVTVVETHRKSVRSGRSKASRKRLLAELEAKERLAELAVKAIAAERALAEARLKRMEMEDDTDEDLDLADNAAEEANQGSVRVEEWFGRHDSEKKGRPHTQPGPAVTEEPRPAASPERRQGREESAIMPASTQQTPERAPHITEPAAPQSDVAALAAALQSAIRLSAGGAPKYLQELPSFDGRSDAWLPFKSAYVETEKCFSNIENVARIRKSLTGAAKEAASCLLIGSTDPLRIMEALERRFGRAEALIVREIERTRALPRIGDNPREICVFANKVANVVATIEALKKSAYLFNPELVRTILEKISPILRSKWYDYAAARQGDTQPDLTRLAAFLNEEADKCGAYAPAETALYEAPRERGRNKVERNFATTTGSDIPTCPECSGAHKLVECKRFTGADVEARWELVRRHRQCFRCVKSNHRRFNCKAKPCGTNGCRAPHHSLLHSERPMEEAKAEEVASAMELAHTTRVGSRRAYLKIAPVVLTGPRNTVEAYALLDEGSTVTIIDEDLVESLGLDGPTEQLWVQGVNGTRRKYDKSKTVDVRVRGKYSLATHLLRGARTVERLDFTTQSLGKEDLEDCPHLEDLQQELIYENGTPKLLIGQDNWELIVSREVRTGPRDRPVASLTQLGWVPHGCRSSLANPVPFCGYLTGKEDFEDEIEEMTKKNEWRWVPTAHNVADNATRATPADFDAAHRWFRGPEFLYQPEECWPREVRGASSAVTGEEREASYATTAATELRGHAHLPDIARFSRWTRLIRATARVLQFVERCRGRTQHIAAAKRKRTAKNEDKDLTYKKQPTKKNMSKQKVDTATQDRFIGIEAHLLIRAEKLWVRAAQQDSYARERRRIERGAPPTGDDKLAALSVTVGADGILRLKGRVEKAVDISEEAASPAVLDGRHPYTRLYLLHLHERLNHGGVELVVNEARQRLWVTRIRPTVKEVLRSCPACRLRKAKPASPSTGNLPAGRLAHHARPFTFTGLDYFGPVTVTVGRRTEKRYVALFTCLTSRAVHLEVAASLSADSAISALRRFVARRGPPKEVWSDNGTNFKAAERELAAAVDAMGKEASAQHIVWRFMPPSAPFMAGAWERMVRAVKEALRATLQKERPSEKTLHTLLAECENVVNSRPLTHVSVDPAEPEALTPNHILIGPNCHAPPPGAFTPADTSARMQWRRAQLLADNFWRRWVREYLPTLQHRREPRASGEPPKIGDLVVIADGNLPRNCWPRGRITRTFPGEDGEVRVVEVTTSRGHVLRRPTKKVIVLPVLDREGDGGRMCTMDT